MLAVLDLDDVAGTHQIARDVELLAVDENVAVGAHLTGLSAARGEPEAGDDVVETSFQEGHQGVAGIARAAAGQLEILAELALEDPVVALDLLLLAQTDRVFARLAPAELVHARNPFAPVDGAFRGVAARPFQEELQTFTAAEPADRPDVASHLAFSNPKRRSRVRLGRVFHDAGPSRRDWTARRKRGFLGNEPPTGDSTRCRGTRPVSPTHFPRG